MRDAQRVTHARAAAIGSKQHVKRQQLCPAAAATTTTTVLPTATATTIATATATATATAVRRRPCCWASSSTRW